MTVEIIAEKFYKEGKCYILYVSYHFLIHVTVNGVCEFPHAWLACLFSDCGPVRITRVDYWLQAPWGLRFKTSLQD